MTEPKKRWKEIDALYAIGIILVLIGHSHSSDWNTFQGTVLEKTINFIYTFHMPLFFFVAGFLFQNSAAIETKGYRVWISEKAVRLLTPYFFWSLIAAVPKYYLENRSLDGLGKTVLDVFINPRASIWGHLWFLPVLFLVYLLTGAARYLLKDKKTITMCLLTVSAVIYFLPIRTSILGLSDLHTSLFFFAVGMIHRLFLAVRKETNIPKWQGIAWIIAATATCVYLTPVAQGTPLVGLLAALMMISVCWVIAELVPVKDWISKHNLTLYIFSWFFQGGMMAVCGKLGLTWLPTFFMMFAVGLLGPVFIIIIFDKLLFLHKRFFKLILGMR